ncbi:YeiH family protein [Amycolatopsis palatopharyngis]|uniref:YeiH family protein n=1 Tax=Amycolatopsis palatopharyngis TaxID=187982 RepID=UPI000E225180|nr:putative sulfate exporter family transporter [Amycolatopsis palatopharyngis]
MATAENKTATVPATSARAAAPRNLLPGLTLVAVGVAVAFLVNLAVPALSALTIAVVLGVVAGNLPRVPDATSAGVRWATRRLLRGGVVLLGLQLAVPQVLQLGAGTILAVVLTVAISFLGTLGLGRLLHVPHGLSVLVATGFSICGASAIAAMEGVVKRKDSDVATAVALVTLYGSLAIVAVPLLGPMLGFTGVGLGEWAGLSVHEVAQVVAAASPAGAAAVATATVVKLSRVVLLAPMVATVSMVQRRGTPAESGSRPPLVPLFVLGFLAMVALRTVDVLPTGALDVAKVLTTLLLAGALFGLGCAVRVRALIRTGPRALLLGLFSTLLVAGVAFTTLQVLA